MHRHHLPIFALLLLGACSRSPAPEMAAPASVDDIARDYVVLELSMTPHDGAHVDAYFGPEALREEAGEHALTLDDIGKRAATMQTDLEDLRPSATGETLARVDGLDGRLRALQTRIAILKGDTLSFDDESRRLFGVTAPDRDAAYFQAIIDQIDALLPGNGSVSQRVNAFRDHFIIPRSRLHEVFDAAIAECRSRTLANATLTPNESFTVEYVDDKPWSGYNWYQGQSRSLIQINTDLPIYINRAVDLGCHEGYPGHHTFNLLLEKNLVDGRGWVEFSLYPLFSPQSLIAEGSGNYGRELAFPGAERIDFEKEVLFPLAGLDPSDADRFYQLQALLDQLNYAGNEAARDYLNGDISREEAAQWLVDYALSSPQRASQRVDFFDAYRSYVINYNLGQDMVADYIERGDPSAAERWQRFIELLSSPMLPRDLLDRQAASVNE